VYPQAKTSVIVDSYIRHNEVAVHDDAKRGPGARRVS
jgi:hypothetical protein